MAAEAWKELLGKEAENLRLGRVEVDTRARVVSVRFVSDKLPGDGETEAISRIFRKRFKECDVRVKITCPDLYSDFIERPENYGEYLSSRVIQVAPGAAPFLRDAVWKAREGALTLTTRGAAGASFLTERGCVAEIENILRDLFRQEVHVVVEAEEYILDARAEADRMEREREATQEILGKARMAEAENKAREMILYGGKVSGEPVAIEGLTDESGIVVVRGKIIRTESRVLKGEKRMLVTFGVHDNTGSILAKAFFDNTDESRQKAKLLEPNAGVLIKGECRYDTYSEQVNLMVNDLMLYPVQERMDEEENKRVELHLHTRMSTYDAVTSAADIIRRAAAWGHSAVAVTDHGVLQAYPEAFDTISALRKKGKEIKLIPGMEGYLVDDMNAIVFSADERPLKGKPIVTFDVETTGLNPRGDRLTEIAAVRTLDGRVIDEFSMFVNPQKPIPEEVVGITGITDEMVRGAPPAEEAVKKLIEFVGNDPLAAHNASFDMAFLRVAANRAGIEFPRTCIDTLPLSRALLPELNSHNLKTLCKHFGVPLSGHHRAINDTRATARTLSRLLEMAGNKGADTLQSLNEMFGLKVAATTKSWHVVLLVTNPAGLFNLYKLTSLSHMEHNYRKPRIPRTLLERHREGLLIGSACVSGELMEAVVDGEGDEQLSRIASFYDFLEVQPLANNGFLVRTGEVADEEGLKEINRTVLRIGDSLGKPVAATSDAHYLDPEDGIFRDILMTNRHFDESSLSVPLYLRTTREMLDEFAYLGEETARRIVIDAPREIADKVEQIRMFPVHPKGEETFQPTLPEAEERVRGGSYGAARAMYGDPLPEIVEKRIERELRSIIGNGFATLYYCAQLLVNKSLEDGYLVGSRGSVGSSFVATLLGITEVNPLAPHYVCPKCKFSDFNVDVHEYPCGVDLPPRDCPECGAAMIRDGYDIPFEVFLGFEGDKVPDIDMNFSGDYQPKAHAFVETLFEKGYVFRAGTIGTLAEKKAYGEVLRYLEKTGRVATDLEKERLAMGITGVKVTTGQHPGGMVIVPKEYDIHHFSPIQHPADKRESGITTHFDFGSLHDILVKLDILGHDDPTMIHMLQRLTGVDPLKIPLNDPKVMSLFTSTEALGVTPEQIGSKTGTLGIPEFGTKFVRGMLDETKPTTMGELLRISGLSHGENVWLNNAQDMIKAGTATLRECFCTRDDIMNTLLTFDMEPKKAFIIMEAVRKGRGLSADMEADMREVGVAGHYIESCKKIAYMFPRSHAAAYVMMALRVAYFKVYHPVCYYAAFFTVRADEFDAALMLKDPDGLRAEIRRLDEETQDSTKKDERLITLLEIVLEMRERKIDFHPVDIYESDAREFLISDGMIRPPLNRLPGVGQAAADAIVAARQNHAFISVEDLQKRAKVSKSVLEVLRAQGCLRVLPESNQVSLFNL